MANELIALVIEISSCCKKDTHLPPPRFEELRPQDRLENKGWLNEHLSSIAALCYQDLQAVKEHGHKCFPPEYNIFDYFVAHYHSNLVKTVRESWRGEGSVVHRKHMWLTKKLSYWQNY